MKGGEFWPIVKCVKIHVAQAEVLKTGVVLVDLPGIRDSNAARDAAAREVGQRGVGGAAGGLGGWWSGAWTGLSLEASGFVLVVHVVFPCTSPA